MSWFYSPGRAPRWCVRRLPRPPGPAIDRLMSRTPCPTIPKPRSKRAWTRRCRGTGRRRSRSIAGARALAQPRRVQPPPPALRDPLQAASPLLRHQLPQRPAARCRTNRPSSSTTRCSSGSSRTTSISVPMSRWSATASTTSRSRSATRCSSRPTHPPLDAERVARLRDLLRQYRAAPRAFPTARRRSGWR